MLLNQRTVLTTILLPVLMAGIPAAAAAVETPDLSGAWTLRMLQKSPTGDEESEMVFQVDGHQLQVTLKSDQGEVPCMGYLDGNQIHFYYVRPGKKEPFIAVFTGHVRGDLMGGEVDMGKRGRTTWTATRGADQPSDLAKTWTLQVQGESPSGMNLAKMAFSQDGANIVVTLTSELGEVRCKGTVEGRRITFYYVRAVGDGQFVARFDGEMAGALMGGEVDMGDRGKTTWRATQDV